MQESGKALQVSDVIVTFNWDTLLENALESEGITCKLKASGKGIPVYKLHGSIDWVASTVQYLKHPSSRMGRSLIRLDDLAKFMDANANQYAPLIIPPTAFKHYPAGIRTLWRQANSALANASEVIVVGYSMPPTDFSARAILRMAFCRALDAASGKILVVIDRAPEVFKRFQKVICPTARWIRRWAQEVRWERVSQQCS